MTPVLRGLATRLGAGGLAQRYYHEPISRLRNMIREGGPLEQQRTERGRLEMIAAAAMLPPLPHSPGPNREVFFLSGEKYWYQTLFCAWSMQCQVEGLVTPVIYDDGSFTEASLTKIRAVIPRAQFVLRDEIQDRLETYLPERRFPTLRRRRLDYPHLRKLTDIHIGRSGWNVVLDSDMLFHRRPQALLDWFETRDRACCLVDVVQSYGYSDALMTELAGGPMPELVNVGVCALRSDDIDWEALETWCRVTIEREGANYVQEQALSALLMAGKPLLRLPELDYVVRPSLKEGADPRAVLHHYVAESKRSYFQHGWRLVAKAGEAMA